MALGAIGPGAWGLGLGPVVDLKPQVSSLKTGWAGGGGADTKPRRGAGGVGEEGGEANDWSSLISSSFTKTPPKSVYRASGLAC